MSEMATPERALELIESLVEEQPQNWYPVILELEYKLWSGPRLQRCGRGRTRNISSCAVQFEADDALPAGTSITLNIEWPCLLNGECGLKLRVAGHVAQSLKKRILVRFNQYEFHTAVIRFPRTPGKPSGIRPPQEAETLHELMPAVFGSLHGNTGDQSGKLLG